MSIFMLLLELGVPIVVRIAGTMERGTWYNNYPVRGLVFIFVGSITLPDRNWVWYVKCTQVAMSTSRIVKNSLFLASF